MSDDRSDRKSRYLIKSNGFPAEIKLYDDIFTIELAPGAAPPVEGSEEEFLGETINNQTLGMGGLGGDNPSSDFIEARRKCAQKLRAVADDFRDGSGVAEAIRDAAIAIGNFEAREKAIDASPVTIKFRPLPGADSKTALQLAYDFEVRKDISNALEEDSQKIVIETVKALTVVKTAMRPRDHGLIRRLLAGRVPREGGEERLEKRLDEYVMKLAAIADIGARDKKMALFASLMLNSFKDDFISLEADRIKSEYVKVLGWHAFAWATAFGLVWMISIFLRDIAFFRLLHPYLVLAIGACGGAWLSFALRRVVLGYSDLALLEDDRMTPTARILFVVGLTWIVGMFINSGLIKLSISGEDIRIIKITHGLLIGALCGIAERALAGVVSARADTFVKSLEYSKLEAVQPKPSAGQPGVPR